MSRNSMVVRCLWLLLAVMCSGCDGCRIISQFPVITAVRPTWSASTQDKVLAATIVQNNGPLDPVLRVRCDVFVQPPRGTAPQRTLIDAERLAGNAYNCRLPEAMSEAIRTNDVLVFEWIVESLNAAGGATPVARSEVIDFHVGCDNPAQFLREDQQRVRDAFAGLTTVDQIAGAGFVPTHPTVAFVGGISLPANKVFTGMGVAFARAADILASGEFVPSGVPESGQPSLLLFLPASTVPGQPDVALQVPMTHTLIGWAYAVNLLTSPQSRAPSLGCFPRHEWFFHEEGHHTPDGGFSPGLFSAVGLPHKKLWDLHVWSRPDGLPDLGILNTTGGGVTTPATGYVAPNGSFFYPGS